jgi:hypothetical protein
MRMRTGKRRSATVISARGLPGIVFLVCSMRRLHDRVMCGRARLSSDVSEIKLVFSIPPHRPTPNIAPSWNVAPTNPLPVVRYDRRAGERSLDVMRWGLRRTAIKPCAFGAPLRGCGA